MLDKLQIYIATIAALVVTIAGIVEELTLSRLTVRLVWVIILFYIFGLIVRYYLKKNVFVKKPEEEASEDKPLDEEAENNL